MEAVAAGIGADKTFEMLLSMVGSLGQISATLRGVENGLNDLRNATNQQLAHLKERVGKGEQLNEVQNERIKQLGNNDATLRGELLSLKAAHTAEIADLKATHEKEIKDLRAELQEASRMRWMVRGGLLVVSVIWPIVWQLGIVPLLGR